MRVVTAPANHLLLIMEEHLGDIAQEMVEKEVKVQVCKMRDTNGVSLLHKPAKRKLQLHLPQQGGVPNDIHNPVL